jgi:hypothetical protein
MNIFGFTYSNGYFQTWAASAKTQSIPLVGKLIYALIRWSCGKIIGHEPSKTEWGYGGGGHADVWCRWCNQIGSIPVSDLEKRYENARSTIWGAMQCDIRQKKNDP